MQTNNQLPSPKGLKRVETTSIILKIISFIFFPSTSQNLNPKTYKGDQLLLSVYSVYTYLNEDKIISWLIIHFVETILQLIYFKHSDLKLQSNNNSNPNYGPSGKTPVVYIAAMAKDSKSAEQSPY